jgi:hypothetical protein
LGALYHPLLLFILPTTQAFSTYSTTLSIMVLQYFGRDFSGKKMYTRSSTTVLRQRRVAEEDLSDEVEGEDAVGT